MKKIGRLGFFQLSLGRERFSEKGENDTKEISSFQSVEKKSYLCPLVMHDVCIFEKSYST